MKDQVNENQTAAVPRSGFAKNPSSDAAPCVWFKDDWDESDLWETGCGQTFQFNDGGPKENSFRYCYFCGKPLEELLRSETTETR